jgi:MHS family proline/betaine transporter-like MFS transporter
VITLTAMSATGAKAISLREVSGRTAIFALCLGNAVEWYDFALYGAFATVIGPLFFPAEDRSTAMLAAFATYGTALIVRPVGALVFGRMADVRGRRAVLVPVILLMAGATAAVGFLPGYAAIGVIAPVILILLRAAQGLAAGGELGVAGVFILERAKTRHRGELASWHTSTLALGLGSGMALAALLFVVERANPAEHGWWRLAFVLALPLGLVGMFVRRRVIETSQFLAVWQARETIKQPVPTLWANYRLALIRGFALIAADSLAFNTFFIFMPNHLAATMRLDIASTLSISALTLLVAAAAAVTLGRLSDLVGRRPGGHLVDRRSCRARRAHVDCCKHFTTRLAICSASDRWSDGRRPLGSDGRRAVPNATQIDRHGAERRTRDCTHRWHRASC